MVGVCSRDTGPIGVVTVVIRPDAGVTGPGTGAVRLDFLDWLLFRP